MASEQAATDSSAEIQRWSRRVKQFLSMAIGPDAADEFASVGWEFSDSYDELAMKRGYLEGLIAIAEGAPSSDVSGSGPTGGANVARLVPGTRRIFVVHGHDGEAKEAVARFLEKLGLEPVILHEQANQGRTIIEKFEVSSSDVAFAVVLLTPDDLGGPLILRQVFSQGQGRMSFWNSDTLWGDWAGNASVLFTRVVSNCHPIIRAWSTSNSTPPGPGRPSLHKSLSKRN